MHPMVGIPACARLVNGTLRHDAPARYAGEPISISVNYAWSAR